MLVLLLAADLASRPPKFTLESNKAPHELTACISEKLAWLASPSVLPAVDDTTTVLFNAFGRTFTRVSIRASKPSVVEVRGVSGGRVRRSIAGCL